jgi:hypothetical protein
MKKYVKPQVAVYVIESQLLQMGSPDDYTPRTMLVNPNEEGDGEVL